MKNKLPLIALIIILAGIVAFTVYNKQPHVCNDPNCKDNQKQPVSPPDTMPDGIPNQPEAQPPAIIKGKTYTYAEGLDLCKRTKIPMFVVFGADWCTWCKKLDVTLASPEITALTDKYIKVHVDWDKEKDVVNKLKQGARGVPVYCMVDENEQVLKESSGYKTVQQFKQWWGQPAVIEEDGGS